MKRKIAVITGIVLAAIVVLAIGVPALAQTSSDSSPSVAAEQQTTSHKRVLVRLLRVQDVAKVDELIARAKESGKITEEQAAKLKEFWTEHHEQFTKKWVLTRIIWAKDGDRVQVFLDRTVADGKMRQETADKLMQLWDYLH